MAGAVYICNPGQSFIPLGTQHDVCRCKHERLDHWWGGGDCGHMFSTGSSCRCQYWREPRTKRLAGGTP